MNRLIDLLFLFLLCALLLPRAFGQDWQTLHDNYAKLNHQFARLSWSSIYEREVQTFYTRGQRFTGYKWQWSPFDKYEVICAPGKVPLPHEVSDTFAWDKRWWLGVVYQTVLNQKPKSWFCKDQRCSFVVDSEHTKLEQETANTWNGQQKKTRMSATGSVRVTSDDQIGEYFLEVKSEDLFKRGVIDAQTLWIEFQRHAEFSLLLPEQTTIENKRGKTRWTNRMTFSNYQRKD